MRPFADHLGIIPDEFTSWKDIIASGQKCVLLVEGEIDKSYFEFLRSSFPSSFPLPDHVTILPYGGKDALKNTTVISFIKQVIPNVFITFDLDAQNDVQRHLEKIGLQDRRDFTAVGKNKAGKKAIEGLLPDRVMQAVYGREVELVSALNDTGEERRSARSKLKQKLLEEFMAKKDYTLSELKDFESLGKIVSKPFL